MVRILKRNEHDINNDDDNNKRIYNEHIFNRTNSRRRSGYGITDNSHHRTQLISTVQVSFVGRCKLAIRSEAMFKGFKDKKSQISFRVIWINRSLKHDAKSTYQKTRHGALVEWQNVLMIV